MQSAKFNVGKYADGSGPVVTVSFDTTTKYAPRSITLETSDSNWLGVEPEYVDELCRALKQAARLVRQSDTPQAR
jgi:hypothetical protein